MEKSLRKKIIFGLSSLSLLLFSTITGQIAKADNLGDAFKIANNVASSSGYRSTDIYTVIGNVILTILSLVGIIFIVLIIYSGIIWMTAAGNEQKTEKSKETIKNSIIGLIIVLSAYAITYFLINIFGSQIST
jgi:uncharacterized membrane protein